MPRSTQSLELSFVQIDEPFALLFVLVVSRVVHLDEHVSLYEYIPSCIAAVIFEQFWDNIKIFPRAHSVREVWWVIPRMYRSTLILCAYSDPGLYMLTLTLNTSRHYVPMLIGAAKPQCTLSGAGYELRFLQCTSTRAISVPGEPTFSPGTQYISIDNPNPNHIWGIDPLPGL